VRSCRAEGMEKHAESIEKRFLLDPLANDGGS
jgi:hypothetical protein